MWAWKNKDTGFLAFTILERSRSLTNGLAAKMLVSTTLPSFGGQKLSAAPSAEILWKNPLGWSEASFFAENVNGKHLCDCGNTVSQDPQTVANVVSGLVRYPTAWFPSITISICFFNCVWCWPLHLFWMESTEPLRVLRRWSRLNSRVCEANRASTLEKER